MASYDDIDDSTERDWDRQVDSALAGLRASAAEAAPPTLDPERDQGAYAPVASDAPRARGTKPRFALMAGVALVGIILVTVALWPAADAPAGTATTSDAGAAAPAEAPSETPDPVPESVPDSAPADVSALEARLAAQAREIEGLVAERDAARARVVELERALADRPVAPAPADGAATRRAQPGAGEVIPGAWTVSLMTLSARSSADAFAAEVRASGWPADVEEVGVRGGLFRISSGDFRSREAAEAHGATVAAALALDSIWVTRRPAD